MAKGFKHGAGGSNVLNFKVVGNPQPANPRENTIWIDTNTPITGWVASAIQPTEPTEGMVWIKTGDASPAQFNALKKNGIQVYPISAKQYIGGAWVDKTAKSYQNGAWVGWIKDLYVDGSEWESAAMAFSLYSYQITMAPSIVANSDGYTVLQYPAYSGEGRSGAWRLKNAQDLTGRNVLKIQCSAIIPSKGLENDMVPTLYVVPVSNTTWGDNVAASLKIKTSVVDTLELDISALEGTYNIGIGFIWNSAWLGAGETLLTVYDVWME